MGTPSISFKVDTGDTNKKLKDIGIDPIYEVSYNPVASWFYKKINQIELTDFFDRSPTAYTSNWNFGKVKQW